MASTRETRTLVRSACQLHPAARLPEAPHKIMSARALITHGYREAEMASIRTEIESAIARRAGISEVAAAREYEAEVTAIVYKAAAVAASERTRVIATEAGKVAR